MRYDRVNSSLKDIPIPGRDTYLRLLIAKTNSFIRRIRWDIFHKEARVKNRNVRVKKHLRFNSANG